MSDSMSDPFRVLTADPGWQPKDKLPGPTRGSARNYQTMTVELIKAYPIPKNLEWPCWLFLWRLASMPQEALDVIEAWGFVPKSEIVWEKLTPLGKPWFGMGRYVRSSHETCIIATRGGGASQLRKSASVRSRFSAPVPLKPDGTYWHSAKPEVFYTQIIPALISGPYCELFARTKREGWTQFGLELPAPEPASPTLYWDE